jgi:AraC-like DNA-binding protein
MTKKTLEKQVLVASYGRTITVALEKRGIEAAEIFKRAGVAFCPTSDPMRRMGNAEVSALYREIFKVTKDPYFGLLVADSFQVANLHALGFALMCSSTLRDFCTRLSNYYTLVSENLEIRLEDVSGVEAILSARPVQSDICYETLDAFVAFMVRMMRVVSDDIFSPRRIELIRPAPDEGDGPYREYFKCEVLFDRPVLAISMDSAILDVPLSGGSRELAQMHDKTAADYLARIKRQNTADRVRLVIVDNLSSGRVSKELVAEKLQLSPRNLDVKLEREGTKFQTVLDHTRHELSMGYIEQSAVSITEIAYLLGFSDASNFTRAFKRWAGKSPTEYRQSLGLDH